MTKNLADRLLDAIDEKQNPCCVGLDPRLEQIPPNIKEWAVGEYGGGMTATTEAILRFNKEIIDAVADIVPVVKPNIAFYEQFGSSGVSAFERTVSYAKEKGLIVIGDAKRNDIGSTAKAYADGFLGKVKVLSGDGGFTTKYGFNVDFLTVNGYLGSDGIQPFVEQCEKYGKGLFVLVKTSNESSRELQDLKCLNWGSKERPLYIESAALVHQWGEGLIGERGYSPIGAVVGATHPEQALEIRRHLPYSFFLVPGFGAQGGGAKEVVPCFDKDGYGAIVNSSRGIIHDPYIKGSWKPEEFAQGAKAASIQMKIDICRALKKAGKYPSSWN